MVEVMIKTKLFAFEYREGNKFTFRDKLDTQINDFIFNNRVNNVIDIQYSQVATMGNDDEIWVCYSALLIYRI